MDAVTGSSYRNKKLLEAARVCERSGPPIIQRGDSVVCGWCDVLYGVHADGCPWMQLMDALRSYD
jgi:hypothetical protein